VGLFSFLNPPRAKPKIKGKEAIDSNYRYWRLRVFFGMYIGYALYYFSRKSFTFAMPAIIKALGFTEPQMGIVLSVSTLAYGVSKFVSGVLGDRTNPKYLMGLGLIITGLLNILIGATSALSFFIVLWGLNGWFQGWGWPPCARLLTHWYSQSERGRWWSVWNTSHNIGGALIPLLVSFVAQEYGWRSAMVAPGVICILGGLLVMNRLTDTPHSEGLPTIEEYKDELPEKQAKAAEKKLSTKEILITYVLSNPYVWLLAISSFFVYIIRQAVNDWSVLYLVQAKGFSNAAAGGCLFWFEIGGFFGSLAAGWLSDAVFGGKRGPINVLFSAAAVASLFGFYVMPQTQILFGSLFVFLIGFAIFGPQMMIGMAAAELSHKNASATATGLTGWISYIGATFAGYPIAVVKQVYGWEGFFAVMGACGIIATVLLLPLWSVKVNTKYID
jgi:OPA family sugar phosphate sensor protein UhpC-like MFS transporter